VKKNIKKSDKEKKFDIKDSVKNLLSKLNKKILINVAVVVAVVIAVLLIIPYPINNVACNNFRAEVEEAVSTAPKTEVVEIISGCVNAGGAGNEARLWVGVLIETDLSIFDMREEFKNVWGIHNFKDIGGATRTMKDMKKSFSEFEENKSKSYYIVEFVKDAPFSKFDLRGM